MAFAQAIVVTLLSGCVSNETLQLVLPIAVEWWSFFAFAAIVWTVCQAAKSVAPDASTSKSWELFWQILPFIPVALGVAFGMLNVLPLPVAVVKAHASGSLYYGASGVLACYAHDIWQTWMKYKHD